MLTNIIPLANHLFGRDKYKEVMIKPTTKQIFLIKMVLATVFAIEAGGRIAFTAEYSSQILGNWLPAFIYTFYPLACIVIMQWLLLSDYLPRWWTILGFVGCVIAATAVGIIFHFITNETFNMYDFELGTFKVFVSGVLVALPQLFILRGRKGYLWILANSVGWTIQFIAWRVIFIPPVHNSFPLAFLRMLVLESPGIILGLFIGLYLYTYIYESNHLQTYEGRN